MSLEAQSASAPANQRTKRMVLLAILLGVVGILLIAVFVWPSRYQYSQVYLGMLGEQEIREDRFSDKAHICGAGKWQSIEISSDGRITFQEEVHLTVGVKGDTCSHAPWLVIAALVCIAVAEAVLIFFLVTGRRKRAELLTTEPL